MSGKSFKPGTLSLFRTENFKLIVPEIRKTYLTGTIKAYYWKFSAKS
jgi:hypothetical protein